MKKRRGANFLLGLMVAAAVVLTGCEGDQGPAGPMGDIADITCAECHNDTNLITGKWTQWIESGHGMGESYARGTRSSCAGCHSGNGFAERVAAGLDPDEVTEGDPDPTRQDCRACHQIHDTFTIADFALRITTAIDFYAVDGATYDGGDGTLCASCHQPRRTIPAAVDGVVSGISEHWGPHHGGQGSMILGVGGAGAPGTPGSHYSLVDDTCVHCHMGDESNHDFEPDVDRCESCHPGAEDFDIDLDGDDVGTQTEVQGQLDILGAELVRLGLIDEATEDGHPTVTEAPEAQALALWNWIYIAHEDKSLGVHNPAYTRALLAESLAALGL